MKIVTCDECGQIILNGEERDNDYGIFCGECHKELFTDCDNCGEEYENDELVEIDREFFCADCRDELFYICEDCNEYISLDDMVSIDNGNTYVCQDCADNSYYQCMECDDYFSIDNVYRDSESNALCRDCYSDGNYSICENCEEFISEDDTCYSNDCPYCNDCYKDEREYDNIEEYGYKPSPEFRNPTKKERPLFMGIELEVDEGNDADETAGNVIDIMEDFVYCKEDSSLNDGFEIVTHPATIEHFMAIMDNFDELASECKTGGFLSHDADTCGLHIHINRKFLGTQQEQELNISKILYVFEKFWDELKIFSRRNDGQLHSWANRYNIAYKKETNETIIEKMKSAHKSRGRAVNLCNYSTIEFRMFRGTLNMKTFYATIQLIDTIVKRVKNTNIKRLQKMSFAKLVKSNYKELNEYLNTKNLI